MDPAGAGGRRSASPKPRTNPVHQNYSQVPGHAGTKPVHQNYSQASGHAGTNPVHQSFSQASGHTGSLNILSSILRAPHPNLQKGQPYMPVSGGRGQSPIRIITNTELIPGKGFSVAPKASGLSPSRIPTTLPPKKSLSPSRTIYTERQEASPKLHVSIPNQSPSSPSNSMGGQSSTFHSNSMGVQSSTSAQGRQKELLSHLPFLSQTLQGGISHEGLFQQYKPAKPLEHLSVLSSLPKGTPAEGQIFSVVPRRQDRRSPSPGQGHGLPRPAHQSFGRTPTPPHVSTIRRTPSPAHMPMGTEAKGRADHLPRTQAVNLVMGPSQGGKHTEEAKWSDTDFKYGDLLQSINRSQETIQSHLLQRGLSPITPADPIDTKLWMPNPHVHPTSHSSQLQPTLPPYSLAGILPSHSQVSAPLSFSAPSGGGFVTIASPSSVSGFSPVGFTPVILPSQSRMSASPKSSQHARQSVSPKSSYSNVPQSSSAVGVHVITSQQPPPVSYIHVPVPQTEQLQEHIKVYPGRESSRYAAMSVDTYVTQAGPPNVTISSRSNIFLPEKIQQAPKLPRNPFTFPATPPVSLTNEKPLVNIGHSKLLGGSERASEKHRHASDEMPCLLPVSPGSRLKKPKTEKDLDLVEIPQPYNMRLQTLANFPNNQAHRPTYRATSVAIHKAKVGCITNSAKSLDLLRQNLQKSINKDINAVMQSYMDKFFKLGIENIRLNNGESAVTEDHVQAVCRQILEEAKKMYISEVTGRVSVSPARDLSDNVSEAGSSGRRSALGRRRHPSDTDSEHSLKPGYKKKKGRYVVNLTGRSTPSKLALQQSKREGAKFEPDRLTEDTLFVMGSRANKALGFGATRGRLYMKHPDLFKYSGDQDDKTWLYEHQHMPATGGKSYIIVLGDIQELVLTDEYRDAPGINLDALIGFTVPMWMIEKMRVQMLAMRTDLPKQTKYRSRSATPNSYLQETDPDDGSAPKDLPFSSFSSPKQNPSNLLAVSPAEEDLEFLASAGDTDDPSSRLSPFNMTGGFDDTPSQSDLDTLDDEPPFPQ